MCVVTNIEMMKDVDIIEEVINEHRVRVDYIFRKLYRCVKYIKREMEEGASEFSHSNFFEQVSFSDDEGYTFGELIIKFVNESRDLIVTQDQHGHHKEVMDVSDLKKFICLMGRPKMNDDEFFMFLKKVHQSLRECKHDSHISLNEMYDESIPY